MPRNRDPMERFSQRRVVEDEAPRLSQQVPALLSLRLEIAERIRDSVVGIEPPHIRRIVVENAGAMFVLACGERRCREGGHDITYEVMSALRAGRTRFEGDDDCFGAQGSAQCERVMHYVGIATFAS